MKIKNKKKNDWFNQKFVLKGSGERFMGGGEGNLVVEMDGNNKSQKFAKTGHKGKRSLPDQKRGDYTELKFVVGDHWG